MTAADDWGGESAQSGVVSATRPELLGTGNRAALVHRDNMVLVGAKAPELGHYVGEARGLAVDERALVLAAVVEFQAAEA
mgnify:CR=1 FL=1